MLGVRFSINVKHLFIQNNVCNSLGEDCMKSCIQSTQLTPEPLGIWSSLLPSPNPYKGICMVQEDLQCNYYSIIRAKGKKLQIFTIFLDCISNFFSALERQHWGGHPRVFTHQMQCHHIACRPRTFILYPSPSCLPLFKSTESVLMETAWKASETFLSKLSLGYYHFTLCNVQWRKIKREKM